MKLICFSCSTTRGVVLCLFFIYGVQRFVFLILISSNLSIGDIIGILFYVTAKFHLGILLAKDSNIVKHGWCLQMQVDICYQPQLFLLLFLSHLLQKNNCLFYFSCSFRIRFLISQPLIYFSYRNLFSSFIKIFIYRKYLYIELKL